MGSLVASAEGDLYSENSLIFFTMCLVQRLLLHMRCEVYSYGGSGTVSISDTPVALLLSLLQQQILFFFFFPVGGVKRIVCNSSWPHFPSADSDLIRLINKTK